MMAVPSSSSVQTAFAWAMVLQMQPLATRMGWIGSSPRVTPAARASGRSFATA